MTCRWLVKIPEVDYTQTVLGYTPVETVDCRDMTDVTAESIYLDCAVPNPRTGTPVGEYRRSCERLVNKALETVKDCLKGDVLVLGTEEYMYPALRLSRAIEQTGLAASVMVHATTRSPIAVCLDSGYPITKAYELSSFYEKGRNTYLYNMRDYDTVIVLSDAAPEHPDGPRTRAAVCKRWGARPVFLDGGSHV